MSVLAEDEALGIVTRCAHLDSMMCIAGPLRNERVHLKRVLAKLLVKPVEVGIQF